MGRGRQVNKKVEETDTPPARLESLSPATRSFASALRAIRAERGLSLQQLADAADVSKSMISKLERGDVQPSLDMAIRLAEALGTRLNAMICSDARRRVMPIRRSEQATFRDPGGAWERRLLSPSFKASKIEVLGGTLAPGAKTGRPVVHQHDAEEYIVVIRGKLTARLGEDTFVLEEGDSLFFEGDQPHVLENPAAQPAEYIVVIRY